MRLIEGTVAIDAQSPGDGERFADVDAFLDRLTEIGSEHGVAVQAFDGKLIAGRAHLETAVKHANRSVARDEAIAEDRAVEVLCYAAGTRQIDRALALGVDPGVHPVVIVVDDGQLGVRADNQPPSGDEAGADRAVRELVADSETLEERDEEAIREQFEVTAAERRAVDVDLETLVCERVALLDVEK